MNVAAAIRDIMRRLGPSEVRPVPPVVDGFDLIEKAINEVRDDDLRIRAATALTRLRLQTAQLRHNSDAWEREARHARLGRVPASVSVRVKRTDNPAVVPVPHEDIVCDEWTR